MQDNRKNLISLLVKSDSPKTSKQLASDLNVSYKTITNYINEINADKEIIYNFKGKYWIDKIQAENLLNEKILIPQNYDERSEYIISRLLSYHNEAINIYKLCDDLCISYSTVKNDIAKLNQQYRYLDIHFFLKNNCLQIEGKERNKRKLMSKIIYDQHKNIMSIKLLADSFPNIQISLLAEIINKILKTHNYYLNDFARLNLLIHYSIIIDRMQNGHKINSEEDFFKFDDMTSSEKSMISDFVQQLSSNFNITLSENEMFDLLIVIRTNCQKTDIEQTNIFKEHIDNEIIKYVDRLIHNLKDIYYLDLDDDQFIVPFTLHLNNLLKRIKFKHTIQNPLAKQLIENSPILYDIALFIAKDFCDYFHINYGLSDDEIGFLTIHIGSQIERDNVGINKLNIILVCPDYINTATSIRNKLLYNLGTKINIIETVSAIDIINESADAIISTIFLDNKASIPTVNVSPFISDQDLSNIYNTLTIAKNKKNINILQKNFESLFNKNTFIIANENMTKEQAIHLMATSLYKNGNVKIDYEEKILIREKSAPTSFYNFAIPHSFEMEAEVSGICVLISHDGIKWNNNTVNIVLMLAINKKDNIYFYQLYDAIINIFTDEKYKNIIKEILSYEQFKAMINNY